MGTDPARARRRVERRLFEVHERLRRAREELEVIETQLSALSEQADEARIRMLVSENSGAGRASREASGHAERMSASRDRKLAEIRALEVSQDELLGQLVV